MNKRLSWTGIILVTLTITSFTDALAGPGTKRKRDSELTDSSLKTLADEAAKKPYVPAHRLDALVQAVAVQPEAHYSLSLDRPDLDTLDKSVIRAIRAGKLEEVQDYLNHAPQTISGDERDVKGRNILQLIADLGTALGPKRNAMAQAILVKWPYLVNTTWGASEDTPLHTAAYRGHPELVATLLSAKSDPNVKNRDNSTPLSVIKNEFKGLHKTQFTITEMIQSSIDELKRDAQGPVTAENPSVSSRATLSLSSSSSSSEAREEIAKSSDASLAK